MKARPQRRGDLAVSRKLSNFVQLSSDDIAMLERVVTERVHHFRPREDVIRQGETHDTCTVLISGWACRYKVLEDGRRQILALLLPGDTCDYGAFHNSQIDHSIAAVGPLVCGRMPYDFFESLSRDSPPLSRAFLLDTLATLAIQREWAVNLGQRDSYERMAHLFCELFHRLAAVGLTNGNSCECPLTQSDLGDTLGISSVHVNRTIQEMRSRNLVVMGAKTLTITDLPVLQLSALFEPDYLSLFDQV